MLGCLSLRAAPRAEGGLVKVGPPDCCSFCSREDAHDQLCSESPECRVPMRSVEAALSVLGRQDGRDADGALAGRKGLEDKSLAAAKKDIVMGPTGEGFE